MKENKKFPFKKKGRRKKKMNININKIIANNILSLMEAKKKTKEELAAVMRMSKGELHWLLNGRRPISAVELRIIAEFLEVEMKELTKLPSSLSSTSSSPSSSPQNFPSTLSEKEKEREGVKEAMGIAKELAEMVEFHERVKENGEKVMRGWVMKG